MISRIVIVFWCLAMLPAQLLGAGIMVNEYYNGSGTVAPGTKMARDEFIEFVIVEETSAATLAGMTFGDSNDATSQLSSVFQFDLSTLQQVLADANLKAFLPGSLIVVKGADLGAQSLGYDPVNGSWAIQIVAGQGAVDAPETRINGSVSLGNNGDTVWISSSTPARNSDTSGIVHAIGHDNAPGLVANTVASAFGSENILPSTVPTGTSVANVGNTTEALIATQTPTLGQANGGDNSLWISNLRGESPAAAPEPGRGMFLLLGSASFILRRKRKGGCHA
ncbi:MAG: hypothetical protein ACO1TE_12420 [Prosthecobacter sp.]